MLGLVLVAVVLVRGSSGSNGGSDGVGGNYIDAGSVGIILVAVVSVRGSSGGNYIDAGSVGISTSSSSIST